VFLNPKSLQLVLPSKFLYGLSDKAKRAYPISFHTDDVASTIREMGRMTEGRAALGRATNLDGLDVDYGADDEPQETNRMLVVSAEEPPHKRVCIEAAASP
jgi:hypothetical protein